VTATATRAGLLVCETCNQLNRPMGTDPGSQVLGSVPGFACARCGASLHWRKPDSLARAWAFTLAAAVLYLPANLLPVMESGSLFESQSDTIMSGVRFLWRTGDWLIAAIIFIASIVLPGAKLAALTVLLTTTQRRSTWRPEQRTRIYRMMEAVGRWSMVDIFVAAVLVALVQFKTIAMIQIGPGAAAFAAVVLLTMFASMSFDPRLIWDPVDRYHE
jgi:paraquat-inducible protein A